MRLIRSYIKKISSAHLPFVQVLFVFLAFSLMGVVCYIFADKIERRHLEQEAVALSMYIESQLDADLNEFETILNVISETIRMMILRGASYSEVTAYITDITAFGRGDANIAGFHSVFALFDVFEWPHQAGFNGIAPDLDWASLLLSGTYVPHEREWYTAAVAANGMIAAAEPYENTDEDEVAVTYARCIFGDDGNRIAVICLDISLERLRKLNNDRSLGIAAPADSYKNNLNTIFWFLVILGFSFALGLSIILIRIYMEKLITEKRMQIMLNSAPFGVNFFERKNYKVIDCNQAALVMFGITDKEEYKARFHEFSPEFQPSGVLSNLWRPTLLEEILDRGGGQFEWTHLKPNGELLPCEITIVRSTYKEKDIYMAYMRDLRETKAVIAEKDKAIEEKNMLSNLGNIMNCLDVMIYVTDPNTGEILFINDAMKKHYSIQDDCVGKLCYKTLQKDIDTRCSFCPCIELDSDPGKTIVWEEHSTLTNRIYRNIDRYIEWPNGKLAHMQHSVDMTELIAAKDEAEQNSRYKSAFLASMSHEIRTPMNAILGIAEIQLRKNNLSPDNEESFSKIYESGDMLLNIINDILDLSKIEAGKLELNPVKYDIPSLINDTAQLNRLRYESKPILFSLQIDEDTPHDLFGDELRIKQVLNNILSNAFKYTSKGNVELSVSSIYESESDDVTIVFKVSDTGQGMTEAQIDKLFDEYTRFNLEANRTTVGAGLGMSITKRLVDLMEGKIFVESKVDEGSVFTVHIPQKRIGSALCSSELTCKLREFSYHNTLISKKVQFMREYMPYGKVLIVDDVESNIYVIKGMLVPYGINIESVSNAFDAIDKIKNGNVYDIIFMDHMMPKMDGMEAVKIIRSMEYKHNIIALTANVLIGREQIFLQNGFDGFLSKPVDSRELNRILNEFIRNRKDPDVVEAARKEQRNNMMSSNPSVFGKEIFFIRDAENAVKTLEELSGKIQAPDDEEIKLYITTVHGIKSALANIGEYELSGTAHKLEKAGYDRNLSVIQSETAAFMEMLRYLIVKLKPVENDSNIKISDENAAYLRRNLFEIKNACVVLDKKTIKAKLKELRMKKWPGYINAILDDIAIDILHSEFKKAAIRADEYLF